MPDDPEPTLGHLLVDQDMPGTFQTTHEVDHEGVLRIHLPCLDALPEVNRNVVRGAALNPLVTDSVLPEVHTQGGRCLDLLHIG